MNTLLERGWFIDQDRVVALSLVVVLHILAWQALRQGHAVHEPALQPPRISTWLRLLPEPPPEAAPSATMTVPPQPAARGTRRRDTALHTPTSDARTEAIAPPPAMDAPNIPAMPTAPASSAPPEQARPLDLTPRPDGPRPRGHPVAPSLSPAAQAVQVARRNLAPGGVFDRALGSAQRIEERIDDDRFRVRDAGGCTEYHRPAVDQVDPFNASGQKRPWLAKRC